jgi:hypothetical protein
VLQAAAYRALGFMAGKIGQDQEADGYVQEARRISRAIDDRFWQADQGYYAPAVYPLTGARHQAPFAPVNLRPLWLGLPEAPDSRARSNVDAVADLIGFTGITPNCDYTIGAAPGYLLAGLVEAESDLAPVALANLAAMASPAGEWAELYGPGGLPCAGADAERPRRARPWETGINLDALYRYFRTRRAWQEPDTDFRGVTRRGRTYGPGPSRRFQAHDDDLAASRAAVVVVTAEPGEVAEARALPEARNGASLLVVEPGRILAPGFLQPLLFDQSHARAATVLMLGASALAGDRRSMKPGAFWRSRDLVEALERFQAAGGRVLRGA